MPSPWSRWPAAITPAESWPTAHSSSARLYWAILAAALYLALTVRICEPIAYWCLDFSLPVGSLLASMILFFVPLALLAMTGPFLVRVITSSVAGVGGNVGRLTSLSTLGSLGGTLLIGYLLIPLLPNSLTMYFTALALMLVCAGYFLFRRRLGPAVVVLLLALGSALGGKAYLGLTHHYTYAIELFRGNSHFGMLQVVDARESSYRMYLNDSLIQNTYDPDRKLSVSLFTYALSGLARAYTTNIADALCIGLGVGVVPMDFARQGARVDVVEINPAVVPVAVRFFDLQTNQLHLTLDDGRHFLNRCRKQYDTVILDAFLGDSSPSHLLTREAFAAIHRVLRPGGTLVINSFCSLEDGRDFFAASLNKTLQAVFRSVRAHSSGDGAIFFVASDRAPLEFVHPTRPRQHPSLRPPRSRGHLRQRGAALCRTRPRPHRRLQPRRVLRRPQPRGLPPPPGYGGTGNVSPPHSQTQKSKVRTWRRRNRPVPPPANPTTTPAKERLDTGTAWKKLLSVLSRAVPLSVSWRVLKHWFAPGSVLSRNPGLRDLPSRFFVLVPADGMPGKGAVAAETTNVLSFKSWDQLCEVSAPHFAVHRQGRHRSRDVLEPLWR